MRQLTATEVFTFSNSLINSNLPPAISTEKYMEKFSERSEIKAGLFDSAAPNFSTYYPDVTPADLEPQEGDFYMPLVRALSAITLNKYGPIDFSLNGVLKASVKFLEKQTVYPNHEVMIGNHLGVVVDSVWQKEFTTNDGVVIPAGINARLKIDGKAHPNIVRGMKMDPPAIHSLSVGVTFNWEKSHPKMEDSEFWALLGTFNKDGYLVRRVVSEITSFNELSLVPHGADPYAQVITEKGINDVDYAKRNHIYDRTKLSFSFGAADFLKEGHRHDYNKTYTLETLLNAPNREPTILEHFKLNIINKSKTMTELEKFLSSLVGIEGLELKDGQDSQAVFEALKNAATNLANYKTQLASITKERDTTLASLTTTNQLLDAAKPKLAIYETILTSTKVEAARLYKLAKGDDASTEMLEMVSKCETYDQARVFVNQFTKDTEGQFSGKCSECGSGNVTRMSAEDSVDGLINPASLDKKLGKEKPKSSDEVFKSMIKSSYSAENLHGNTNKSK